MDTLRIGNFTSSNIHKLLTKDRSGKGLGQPALNYIRQKVRERRMGTTIDSDVNTRSVNWGKLVERYAHLIINDNMDYTYQSNVTIQHPAIDCWVGTPDVLKLGDGTVGDIKCPYTRNAFCDLYDCKDGETLKIFSPEYYWQLVSNVILTKSHYAELIVFMPYQSQLDDIRALAHAQTEDEFKYKWIAYANDEELPYLPDNSPYYNNLHIIRWEVPEQDKDELTEAVLKAKTLLNI
jgi:hypothetical protein